MLFDRQTDRQTDGQIDRQTDRQTKMSKYEQHKLPGGSLANVILLVMEHFGSWGEEARNSFAETGSLFVR